MGGGGGRISKGRGYILRGRGRFWEGKIDYGRVTYSCRKGGYIMAGRVRLCECRTSYQKRGYLSWEGGVDSGRVAYRCLNEESYIQRRRGRFWEGRKDV